MVRADPYSPHHPHTRTGSRIPTINYIHLYHTPISQAPEWSETKTESVTAHMNGNILEVKKKAGDTVEQGETLIVMSAMKLETEIVSPVKGVVKEIGCVAGDQVIVVILISDVKIL